MRLIHHDESRRGFNPHLLYSFFFLNTLPRMGSVLHCLQTRVSHDFSWLLRHIICWALLHDTMPVGQTRHGDTLNNADGLNVQDIYKIHTHMI